MLFNSYEFIFAFLPITFFVYFYLNSKRLVVASKSFLVFSSLCFYSYWNIAYLPLILGSMLFNYSIGNSLSQDNTSIKKGNKKVFSNKIILTVGIFCNLVLLGYFKYADFFIENLNFFVDTNIELLNLLLPLAISFFTFQQIAYLVDSYRKETEEYDFLNYALFVTFFPQLIAGPIVHHKEMMPQFVNTKSLVKNYKNITLGIFIFSMGLFKKVVIADTFSKWANTGFDVAETLNFFEAWITSLSYTFQLYFDFSGYTDMAIGIALLFNIKLPINFNSPYKASDIQDFWRRWHITLSRFLRDYVYIPLGGNKLGSFRTYINLMATFIIGGLWHGAGWTFIFWGLLHGLALSLHRAWQLLGIKLPKLISWFITFNFINITWVFFRANEWEDALRILSSMFSLDNIVVPDKFEKYVYSIRSIEFSNLWLININGENSLLWILVCLFIVLYFKNTVEKIATFKTNWKFNIFIISILTYSLISLYKVTEFLYFNF